MPDLEDTTVRPWFQEHFDESVPLALRAAPETVSLKDAFSALFRALDEVSVRDRAGLATLLAGGLAGELLQTLLTEADPASMARVLTWLAAVSDSEFITSLIHPAKGPSVVRDRLIELNRQGAIARIYAPARVDELVAACRVAFKDDLT